MRQTARNRHPRARADLKQAGVLREAGGPTGMGPEDDLWRAGAARCLGQDGARVLINDHAAGDFKPSVVRAHRVQNGRRPGARNVLNHGAIGGAQAGRKGVGANGAHGGVVPE